MSNGSQRTATTKLAIVAAAAFAAHVTALGAGFIWLDHGHIEEGWAIAAPSRWLALFTQGFAQTGFYRPLMALSLSIDALVGGAFAFHLVTLAWHAAASVMTALAGEALGVRRRVAFIAGLLFAVHPLGGLVANAIAFRSEAMVTTMLLLLVWAHLRGRPVVAALAVLAGCLTKEIAFGLAPLFVIAVELLVKPPRRVRVLGAEAAALGVAVAMRVAFAPPFRAHHQPLGFGDAVGTRLAALAKSATLFLAPVDLSICDAFPVTHLHQPRALVGLAVVVALGFVAWRRRGPAVLLALALLPSLQLVPVMRWWSPHYVYLPATFALLLVAEVLERAGERATKVAYVVAAVLGVVSVVDARNYATDSALWSREVQAHATCREGHFFLGEVDRDAKRWDDAARHYEAALAPRPNVIAYVDRGAALVNLGTVRLEQGRFREAREIFRGALDGIGDEPKRREVIHDLAAAALQDGDPAEAERLLAPETARPDALPASLVVRAIALERLGRHGEAAELRKRAAH